MRKIRITFLISVKSPSCIVYAVGCEIMSNSVTKVKNIYLWLHYYIQFETILKHLKWKWFNLLHNRLPVKYEPKKCQMLHTCFFHIVAQLLQNFSTMSDFHICFPSVTVCRLTFLTVKSQAQEFSWQLKHGFQTPVVTF